MFFTTKPEQKNTKFEKTEFMRFEPGVHLVRILGEPKGMYSHYLPNARISIKCLLEDCPICKNNRQLMMENPENFRNIKGWSPRQYRHYFNVLDKTLVKVCPNCNTEVSRTGSNFPASCPACNAIIPQTVKEAPSGKVKLASISDTNASLINTQAQGYLDSLGDSANISDFTFMFTVIRSDNKKTILPSVASTANDGIVVEQEKLYSMDKALVSLTEDEIKDVLKGISLKDIFAARRIKTDVEPTSEEIFDANKAVSVLFAD
jgi:hypothetical protein